MWTLAQYCPSKFKTHMKQHYMIFKNTNGKHAYHNK